MDGKKINVVGVLGLESVTTSTDSLSIDGALRLARQDIDGGGMH
jgi:hypothetical protein